MVISHRIELVANNRARTYFHKAFGCANLAYNWGLEVWKKAHAEGKSISALEIKKMFNSIKRERYPFVYEVSKCAVEHSFDTLSMAMDRFESSKKVEDAKFPNFRKRRRDHGSFYLGGDQIELTDRPLISSRLDIVSPEKRYLRIPKLGYVKMREAVRFRGRIIGVTISQNADRYYASFVVEISPAEFRRTHGPDVNRRSGVGVDAGIESFATLSNGLKICSPRPLKRYGKRVERLSRRLSRRTHPESSDDNASCSKNYIRARMELASLYRRISNIRTDFTEKLSTLLARYFGFISLEELGIGMMMKTHSLAGAFLDSGFYAFRIRLVWKAGNYSKRIITADRFYPSSQICSLCGERQRMPLSRRVYVCRGCGLVIDRDLNASLNLYSLIEKKIGKALPEYTPVDLKALQDCLEKNGIAIGKVEAGIQQQCRVSRHCIGL